MTKGGYARFDSLQSSNQLNKTKMKSIKNLEWVKQSEWIGNSSLCFDCYMKHFSNPFNGVKTPVYLFGLPESKELDFCVSAGAYSDYSHSGCFYPEKLTWQESMDRIDEMYKNKRLIY